MRTSAALSLALTLAAGCTPAPPEGVAVDGPRVAIAVAPLTLPGVTNARYTLTVVNSGDDVVWTRAIDARDYGDGQGSLSYVGPCDASANPNTVSLTIDGLFSGPAGDVPLTGWADPSPLTRDVDCVADGDTPVTFDLVIVRPATQGFFDIALSLQDLFCSAKVDCQGDDGTPIHLLHRPSGGRGPTLVVALACTAGPGELATTSLHLSALSLRCPNGQGGENVHWLLPGDGPGNAGAEPPEIFQHAFYRGVEQLPGVDKCYWNTAIGLEPDQLAGPCRLSGKATVSAGGFPSGTTPAGMTYPEIVLDVPVGAAAGELDCGANPLGSQNVAVQYAQDSYFDYEFPCTSALPFAPGLCNCGSVSDGEAEFIGLDAGVIVRVGAVESPVYPLPAGATLDACCLTP